MSSGGTPARRSQDEAARTWSLLAVVLIGLGVCVVLAVVGLFVLYGGTWGKDEPAPAPQPVPGALPLPPPEHRDVLEEARGIYLLETDTARFSLELKAGGRFQFVSMLGAQRRVAMGSWNLVGPRLSLVYEMLNGNPFEGPPVVNLYMGDRIELFETGAKQRVILKKRTMVRNR